MIFQTVKQSMIFQTEIIYDFSNRETESNQLEGRSE